MLIIRINLVSIGDYVTTTWSVAVMAQLAMVVAATVIINKVGVMKAQAQQYANKAQ